MGRHLDREATSVASLELRIPPVALAVLIGALMWIVRLISPSLTIEFQRGNVVASAIAILGVAIALAGVLEFRRARTTVDPTAPSKSTSVVTGGVYRFTRNPMYLGFLLVLAGWAFYLSNPVVLLGPALFVFYMNRFQIIPEERILKSRFGLPFERYLEKVRRWV
jgi:protein-S-isoprenylcysteine O-methyltransferase Ste14